jgi:hypothetical protein
MKQDELQKAAKDYALENDLAEGSDVIFIAGAQFGLNKIQKDVDELFEAIKA